MGSGVNVKGLRLVYETSMVEGLSGLSPASVYMYSSLSSDKTLSCGPVCYVVQGGSNV